MSSKYKSNWISVTKSLWLTHSCVIEGLINETPTFNATHFWRNLSKSFYKVYCSTKKDTLKTKKSDLKKMNGYKKWEVRS